MTIEVALPRLLMCYGARMHQEQEIIDLSEVYPELKSEFHLRMKARQVIYGDRAERRMDNLITESLATLE